MTDADLAGIAPADDVRTLLNQMGAMWAGLTDKATGYQVGGRVELDAHQLFGDGSGERLPDAPIMTGNVVEYADGCMTIDCTPGPHTIRWPDDPALYALAERLREPSTTAKPALAGLTTCNDRTDSAGRSPYLGLVG
ncbi:MAG: hypothetical protein WC023_06565 [Rhodocyclaceae bacterium]